MDNQKLYRNKEWLYQQYCIESLSLRNIAKICKCDAATIFNWLNIHEIATRTLSKAQTGNKNAFVPLNIRFNEKVDKNGPNGCWIWIAGLTDGYGTIRINGKNKYAHIVSWEMTNGPAPEGYVLHHECRTRNCVNPDHLLLITKGEHLSLHHKGKSKNKGENNGSAKTTEKIVSEIRADWKTEEYTIKQLMTKYNQKYGNIYAIVNRITWKE